MGKFILLLLSLFAIGCVFYGISAGVQIIQRGFSWLAESARDDASDKRPLITPLPPSTVNIADALTARQEDSMPEPTVNTPLTEASAMQRSIDELRDIFALYQQGELTQAEFESMKQFLLTCIKTAAPMGH